MESNRTKTIAYWATTGLTGLAFVFSGVVDVAHPPEALAIITHLGYPAYLATLIGAWKILGALAVLSPRFPRLKEWAYAGIFFDLSGAALSHGIVGDGAAKVVPPLMLAALAMASWALRPNSRRLADAAPAKVETTDVRHEAAVGSMA